MDLDSKDLLTVSDFQRLTGCARASVYKLIRNGDLPAKKYGRFTVITRADYNSWVASLPDAREVFESQKAA